MTTKRERKALAKKVRAAADYVERVGLHKGALTEYGPVWKAVEQGVRCCTIGAVRGHGLDFGVVDELAVYLHERHPRVAVDYFDVNGRPAADIPTWNDRPSRRKKDVVELLRGFADKLDQKESSDE